MGLIIVGLESIKAIPNKLWGRDYVIQECNTEEADNGPLRGSVYKRIVWADPTFSFAQIALNRPLIWSRIISSLSDRPLQFGHKQKALRFQIKLTPDTINPFFMMHEGPKPI